MRKEGNKQGRRGRIKMEEQRERKEEKVMWLLVTLVSETG